MAFLALLCLLGLVGRSFAAPGKAAFAIGGASSFELVAPALINGPCKASAKGQVYQSVGSGTGVKNFNDGSYAVALSDSPMKPEEETTAASVSLLYKKLTLPIILARYSFFINGVEDGKAKMDAKKTYTMYKNSGKATWKSLGVPLAGKVTAVSRDDSSGTTFVIKRYWKVGGASFLKDFGNSEYGSKKMPFSGNVFGMGSDGVCKAAAAAKGRVCYSQVGVCNQKVPDAKLGEVSLLNKAGQYVLASTSSASLAIPRILPPRVNSYNAVGEQTILQKGSKTPAIVSFVYAFVRYTKLASAGPLGATGKALLTCINSKVNTVATKYQFDTVPATIIKENAKWIAKVK